MKKKVLFPLAALCFISGTLEAVQVIERTPSAGAAFGKGFGEGLSKGVERGLVEAERRRQVEFEIEMHRQAEERNAQIIQHILKNYDVTKTKQYVINILQSSLPKDVKELVIIQLNDAYDEFRKTEEK